MKKAVILSGGEFDILNAADLSDSFIICADGGYEHCKKLGILPDVILGDMDSSNSLPEDVKTVRAKIDKDQTDTQLCIDYLVENGFTSAKMFCAFGGRCDHTFANFMMLCYADEKGIDLTIRSKNETLFIVKSGREICGKAGDTLSLFPIGGDAADISTENLKYPLNNEMLYFDTPRGISNVFKNNTAKVYYKSGKLLAVHIEV